VNGRPPEDPFPVRVRRGERLRLRVINAASDTIFSLAVGGHRLTVVAADGHRVAPAESDALVLGMGERFDVLLDADNPGAHRIVASALGKGGRAVATLRYVEAPRSSMPSAAVPVATRVRTVSYADLRAAEPSPLPELPRELPLELGMDMSQPYSWTINGQAFPEAEPIALSRDEPVRLIFANSTMMAHPMHLHGFVFRPAGAGPEAPFKDTITVSSMATTAVDFLADAPGGWMLHCHNTYHALAGMMRVVDVPS
jgi:FtsP/CotA-like multicopper oxidase with cupredoxin domain